MNCKNCGANDFVIEKETTKCNYCGSKTVKNSDNNVVVNGNGNIVIQNNGTVNQQNKNTVVVNIGKIDTAFFD